MNAATIVLAVIVVGGAVLALSVRDGRLAIVALLASLALAPLVPGQPGSLPAIGVRIVAAALAVYLVRIPIRDRSATRGSRLGWPAEALAAAAAFVAGAVAHGVTLPALGTPEATGAGVALLALAAAPFLERSDPLRPGLGILLALTGADLVRSGLAGTPAGPESIAVSVAVVLSGATVALLAGGAGGRSEPVASVGQRAGRRR